MFELIIKGDFDSAHFLKNYRGKCESIHGHTWWVEAVFEGNKIDCNSGILVDFKDLKKFLNNILIKLDHTLLNKNEFLNLGKENPSCENLAQFIFKTLNKKMPRKIKKKVRLKKVTVWESPNAGATYYEI